VLNVSDLIKLRIKIPQERRPFRVSIEGKDSLSSEKKKKLDNVNENAFRARDEIESVVKIPSRPSRIFHCRLSI